MVDDNASLMKNIRSSVVLIKRNERNVRGVVVTAGGPSGCGRERDAILEINSGEQFRVIKTTRIVATGRGKTGGGKGE